MARARRSCPLDHCQYRLVSNVNACVSFGFVSAARRVSTDLSATAPPKIRNCTAAVWTTTTVWWPHQMPWCRIYQIHCCCAPFTNGTLNAYGCIHVDVIQCWKAANQFVFTNMCCVVGRVARGQQNKKKNSNAVIIILSIEISAFHSSANKCFPVAWCICVSVCCAVRSSLTAKTTTSSMSMIRNGE